MHRVALKLAVAGATFVACGLAAMGQKPTPATPPVVVPASPDATASATPVAGGKLHGVVKSGNTPLPGVTVTAQNTLTGKKYSTTTDITGAWQLNIPQNGRYVIRTQFAGFAQGSQEAVLNATSHDQTVTFSLMLTSRAAAQEQQESRQASQQSGAAQAMQQLAGGAGPESLSLMSSVSADTETGGGTAGASGAELPSVAANSDFGGESVAISGQQGQVSAMAGVDVDRLRDALDTIRVQNGGQLPGDNGGLFGGGGGGPFGGGGGFGGGGFGGRGGGGGGRGNFRGFNSGQPHGAIFWIGTNSAINAQPFALNGQTQDQPPSGSNRFGISFLTAPYIPHLIKPSGKDTIFFTLSGTRQSSPVTDYANVPTKDERNGDFSAPGLPTIYDPTTGCGFGQTATASGTGYTCSGMITNKIPAPPLGQPCVIGEQICSQAANLLALVPQPNLTNSTANSRYNYFLFTTGQTNSTQAGVRYNRSLGKNATLPTGGGRGGGGGGRRNQSQGLRQSINLNFNWGDSASVAVPYIPVLGGKTAAHNYSLQAGYTVGYKKLTNIFNANWNRALSQTTNYYTNTSDDIATALGISHPADIPLNYGVPVISLGDITGLPETQPSFSVSQTISFSEVLSWIHGKHNLRFGGDFRRVHRDSLGGSNATGNFTFSGLFTEDANQDPTTGSPIADLLLGLPQSTSIDVAQSKTYLRDNVFDGFAQDDWRVKAGITLNAGVRYEFFAPYTEKYGHLGFVDTNATANSTFPTQFQVTDEVQAGGSGTWAGNLPASLVFPFRWAWAPRLSMAWRVPKIKQMVFRAGYGMNFTVGQYGSFASTMSRQPLVNDPTFIDEQTNENAQINTAGKASAACAMTSSCRFTLQNGFGTTTNATGTFAVDPHYQLPYVQVYNVDIQKTLPLGIVMNLGYNGSRGSNQNVGIAPRATPSSPGTNPYNYVFTYNEAAAWTHFNAGTVRVNKRLSKGISMGANYQYSHSIDTAAGIAQNWQDIDAEEGNSSFDVRHQVSGNYLYELPFGKDKFWFTTGTASHILEGFSVSGTFRFATGTMLTPTYQAAASDVAKGTAGTLRPDRMPGTSITAGGGSLLHWFNTSAFTTPAGPYGTASRNSIAGPGTVQNNMALSKTVQMGDTRSMEFRATMNNVFNTVQYSGVGTSVGTPTYGEVTSIGGMRAFQFTARFRF